MEVSTNPRRPMEDGELPESKRQEKIGIYQVCVDPGDQLEKDDQGSAVYVYRVEAQRSRVEEPRTYRDYYTGAKLSNEAVEKAREEEMRRHEQFDVREWVPEQSARGHKVIDSFWIDHEKVAGRPETTRSRLVATEVARERREDLYAGTPPMAAIKYVISRACTKGAEKQLAVYDVSVAFFHADLPEGMLIFVRPPLDQKRNGHVWRLKRAMYGTRAAAQAWQRKVMQTYRDGGWEVLKTIPCAFYNSELDQMTVVWGNDFLAEGSNEALNRVDELLENFEIKKKPRAGPGAGSQTEFLHRTLIWSPKGVTYFPDPVHIENVVSLLGVENAKEADSPISKSSGRGVADVLDSLDATGATLMRTVAGIVQYLCVDRYDVQYAAEELARRLKQPDKMTELLAKRIGRYLGGTRDYAIHYEMRTEQDAHNLIAYSDSDWAGEQESRKSTSSGVLLRGRHLLESWSSTQQVIATSSGEVEFYAEGLAAAKGLLVKHFAQEMGEELKLVVLCDSVAGRAIAQRLGVGKVRHIQTRFLWLQERVQEGELVIRKVSTEDNWADAGTKAVPAERLKKCCRAVGLGSVKEWAWSGVAAIVAAQLAATRAEASSTPRLATVDGEGFEDYTVDLLREVVFVLFVVVGCGLFYGEGGRRGRGLAR